MARKSVFRNFIAALGRHWQTALPKVTRLTERHGSLPVASSFDAGLIPATGQRVYLWFQHSAKVPGKFTVNIILATQGKDPRQWGFPEEVRPGEKFGDGPRRIADFLRDGRHDKWWQLRQEDMRLEEWRLQVGLSPAEHDWRPASYDDEQEVIGFAVLDVTADVQTALTQLGALPYGRA
jgi:hypothetical protein